MLKASNAVADIFITALKSLGKREREAVLFRIAQDRALAREVLDLAVITERRNEPSRPFRTYLAKRRSSRYER